MPQFEEFCDQAGLILKTECTTLFGDFPNINDCNECDQVSDQFRKKNVLSLILQFSNSFIV